MDYNITYREKDGGWQYIISYKDSNGKWKQKCKQGFEKSRIGKQTAKAAAEKALDELKVPMEFIIPEEFKGITFEKFGKEYINHTKLYREYKTVQSTQTVLNKFSDLNELELINISTLDVQKAVDSMTEEGLNPNTIKYYLKKLTIIFNSAKNDYKIINTIPSLNIKTMKPRDLNKKALTDKEIELLLLKFKDTKYYLLIFLAINTGMRFGELLGLTWDNIDLKNNEIKVTKQWKKLKDGSYDFGNLKTTNSNRVVPISNKTSNELKKYKAVININNRVFDFIKSDNLCTYLNKALKKYGFNISIHEIRHTFATKLIAKNLDFKTLANILGHDIQQTIKTYSHVNNDMLLKARKLIQNIF